MLSWKQDVHVLIWYTCRYLSHVASQTKWNKIRNLRIMHTTAALWYRQECYSWGLDPPLTEGSPPLSESSSFLTYCHRFIIYDPYIVVDMRYLYHTKARPVHIALKNTENVFKYPTSYLRIFFPACILRLILHVSEQQAWKHFYK